MKWYFCWCQDTDFRADHNWKDLIRASVASAIQNTSLEPHFIYDGEPSEFTSELAGKGVIIHYHRLSFTDVIRQYKPNDAVYQAIARGAFLRFDIPLVAHGDDEYVLYTDADVLFLRNESFAGYRPSFIAAASQFEHSRRSDMNSGVMLINLSTMRLLRESLVDFTIRNLHLGLDQEVLRAYLRGDYLLLPDTFNWKPYWGINTDVSILHWHGPKPCTADAILSGRQADTIPSWSALLNRDKDAYRYYVTVSDRVLKSYFSELWRPSGANVALGKNATQSSVCQWSSSPHAESDAAGAVDGHPDGFQGFHTELEDAPWWQVDLGHNYKISDIRIFNRLDLVTVIDRSAHLKVEVGTSPETFSEVFRREDDLPFGGIDGNPLIVHLKPSALGRFVRITLLRRTYFHLDQVEIYGELMLPDHGSADGPSASRGEEVTFMDTSPLIEDEEVQPEPFLPYSDTAQIRLLAAVNFLFAEAQLGSLVAAIEALCDLHTGALCIMIFTDARDGDEMEALARVLTRLTSLSVRLEVIAYPELRGRPADLNRVHEPVMARIFQDQGDLYTHYLLLDSGLQFTRANLSYFLKYRDELKVYGLLPGFVRHEFSAHDGEYLEQLRHAGRSASGETFWCSGVEFVRGDIPYAGMFLFDHDLMNEYIHHSSVETVLAEGVEQAASSFDRHRFPSVLALCCAVPFDSEHAVPATMCWLGGKPWHGEITESQTISGLPEASNRVDKLFSGMSLAPRRRMVSCLSPAFANAQDGPITTISEVFPSTTYSRLLPFVVSSSEFREKLAKAYRAEQHPPPSSPRSVLVMIKEAFIYGSVIYSRLGAETAIVYETFRSNDQAFVSAPDISSIMDNYVDLSGDADAQAFFLGSAGSFNYGLWLVDDLPRLQGVLELRQASLQRRIIILMPSHGEKMNNMRRASVEAYLAGVFNYTIEFLRTDVPYKIRDLAYLSPVSLHPKVKSRLAIGTVFDRTLPHEEGRAFRSKINDSRLLVLRLPPNDRILLNHAEVSAYLSEYGFRTVILDDLPFLKQVELFRDAEVVIGCMGAAMVNTIFCKRPITVVMLAPEGWEEMFYWDLAAIRGDNYVACYGIAEEADLPVHQRSFTVGIDRLNLVLEHLHLSRAEAIMA